MKEKQKEIFDKYFKAEVLVDSYQEIDIAKKENTFSDLIAIDEPNTLAIYGKVDETDGFSYENPVHSKEEVNRRLDEFINNEMYEFLPTEIKKEHFVKFNDNYNVFALVKADQELSINEKFSSKDDSEFINWGSITEIFGNESISIVDKDTGTQYDFDAEYEDDIEDIIRKFILTFIVL